jgi:hypothetical protein
MGRITCGAHADLVIGVPTKPFLIKILLRDVAQTPSADTQGQRLASMALL